MKIDVRFFAVAYTGEDDDEPAADIVEITESCFVGLVNAGGRVAYERHTVFQNGADQVCLTVEMFDTPDACELDLVP